MCRDQEWLGQVPQCCERDGCPSDLRVDFFFILDSSSSIKDKNFQYVREYVIGLISTMPVGLDKTRVGILTYNNDVSKPTQIYLGQKLFWTFLTFSELFFELFFEPFLYFLFDFLIFF